MKKIIFNLIVALGITSIPVSAQQVNENVAREKALSFLSSSQTEEINSIKRRVPRQTPQLKLANNCDEFYVFNDEANGAYVVVSGDERMPDVLGYSYDGCFDIENTPPNMEKWLEGYAEQVKHLQTHPEAKAASQHIVVGDPISPMLECEWDQRAPYNNMCPEIGDKRTATGCVATAMAQIMSYYQWPKQTTSVIPGYTTYTSHITIPDIPITSIDWDNMLPQYQDYNITSIDGVNVNLHYQNYTKEQGDAVANLMKLCGAALQMEYDINGSAASLTTMANALAQYFGYDGNIVYMNNWGLESWNQMIYDGLKEYGPIPYEGQSDKGGHAFVIDGYDGDDYFHVNWGWGGYNNGYFLLSSLLGYNYVQGACLCIQPSNSTHPKAYSVFDNGKLTFYYDNAKEFHSGEVRPFITGGSSFTFLNPFPWKEYSSEINEIVITPSFANYKNHDYHAIFEGLENLKVIKGLEYLRTPYGSDMEYMFQGCKSLTNLDLSSFNTEEISYMKGMFQGCTSLTSLNIKGFNTSKIHNMEYMFEGCNSLTSLDLSSFNTENVTNMGYMFCGCKSLTSLDLSHFNTTNVTNMLHMFSGCSSLKKLDLSHFNTTNVTNMWGMFYYCKSLEDIDLSEYNTANVTNMTLMFWACESLTSLDLSSFNTENVTNMGYMFEGCSTLETIYVSDGWNTDNVTSADAMFTICTNLVGEKGTKYNEDHSHVGIEYARVDEGPKSPGYLTYKENPCIYFYSYKNDKKSEVDALIKDDSEDEYKKLVNDAKSALDALTYNKNKTLDANKKIVDDIITQLMQELDYLTSDIIDIFLFSDSESDKWYDLNGCVLNNEPTKSGIYIKNGRKIWIR